MLERIEAAGERRARRRAEARRARLVAALNALPGIAAQAEGEAVVLTGRGLARRYERSAALRWAIREAGDE